MKPHRIPPPGDAELDALLARRYHDTTPEFEARWVALKRELRQAPARRRAPWLAWLGALTVGAAALVLLVSHPRHAAPPSGPEVSPALAELFAMDAVLTRGTALLDGENRDALLHLSVPPQPRN
jgi:hypothetical protein